MKNLHKTADFLRINILKVANRSKSAHIGSCLSIIDVLTYLYFQELRIDPKKPDRIDRDYFILSKGHGAMALYAVLAEKGFFDKSMLHGYMAENGTLPAHLDRFSAPGIEVSAGSLGHGLPMALGIAHGLKIQGKSNRLFVLMGDGESQEGSVWEAAMLAPKLNLKNLTAIIDFNNLQGYGRPTEIMHFEPLADKWRAFGWHAIETDGHDFAAMEKAFIEADKASRPAVIILKTVKGKGVSFMEDELKWHYFIVTDELLEQAKKEVQRA